MSEIIQFEYENTQVRSLVDDEGDPWFVAKDVSKLLGYSATSAMLRSLEDDEKGVQNLHTLGGSQEFATISESGMYSAILRSRVPGAKRFKRWVTHVVLPSIRKHGAYMTPAKLEEALLNPDAIIKIATALKEEQHKRIAAESKIVELEPKAHFADAVADSETTILVGELAKILKGNGVDLGQNRLYQKLRDDGWLIKRRGTDWNMPTQKAMNLDLFRVKESTIRHADGHVTINKTTKVTGKGQQFFVNYYTRNMERNSL
ncbi:phage antirepressor [Schaalia sp. ZJ1691]|uniref:phage antirepressor n=1 Tax=Schaalia sp. ZJ1691 TaxID=2709404 RepID=UPI0013EB53C2|nr:phage antirepressor [Schaalia sp. ZJ1691]